jgi:hypothetical protein
MQNVTGLYRAFLGYPGETVSARFIRLCETEAVPYEITTGAGDTLNPTTCGPQRAGNFIDQIQDTVAADDGLLYELRTALGYGFRTRQSLYMANPALTLNYTNTDLGEVPEVTHDDQQTRNIVRTKRRGNAGEFTSKVTTGPQGTTNIGDWEEGVIEVNVETDIQARDYAAFRTFKGTWDEDRWPALTVYLHRTPFTGTLTQLTAAAFLEIGEIISIINTPVWLGADDTFQQMRSVAIKLSNFTWGLVWTLLPGGPYNSLNEFDSPDESRLDTTQCFVVLALSSGGTEIVANTWLTEGRYNTPLWTRDPGEFNYLGSAGIHFRINPATLAGGLGGEKVTAGALANVRDTFTRSAAQLAGTTTDTGELWAQTAGTATNWTVNGSAAIALHTAASTDEWVQLPIGTSHWDIGLSVDMTLNFTTATGGQFITDVSVRHTDTSNNYFIRVVMDISSSTIIMQVRKVIGGGGVQLGNNYIIGANVAGTPIHIKAAIWASNFYAKMWTGTTTEPDWQHKGYNDAPPNETTPQNGTAISLRSIRLAGNTNVNASSTWDNLKVWRRVIQPYRWDRFARTAADAGNTSNPGGLLDDQSGANWQGFYTGGGTDADVDYAPNKVSLSVGAAAASTSLWIPSGVNFTDGVASVIFTTQLPLTAALQAQLIMRMGSTSAVDTVAFVVDISTTGLISLGISPQNAAATLNTTSYLYTAGTPFKLKAACFGTQLMMKVWDPTTPEPPYWQLVVTDPAPRSGSVGFRGRRNTSNTNTTAPQFTFHQFELENPQRIAVTRGVNGVVRAWDANSDFHLWSPIRLGR